MKKQKEKQVKSLDDFDETVSLHQLLPSGTGKGLKKLKTITDSILNSKVEQSLKPLSLLICGKQGVRTHARSFLRSIGLETPLELPAPLFQSTFTEVFNFFNHDRFCDSYIISSFSLLFPSVLITPYQIITTGQLSYNDTVKKCSGIVAVYRPLIMTTHNKDKVPKYFQQKIDHIVELEDYTTQQQELIILQRLKYANLDYQEEKVLQLIVEYGMEHLDIMIRLLKSAITVMLADSRTILTVKDVEKAVTFQ
jgi:hypothetical protein